MDALQLPRMVHGAFVRSEHAHALIRFIDTAAARAHPGVVAVRAVADGRLEERAAAIGLDPVEMRRRNLIPDDAYPPPPPRA